MEEAPVSVTDAMEADEMFTTGTAVVRGALLCAACWRCSGAVCCVPHAGAAAGLSALSAAQVVCSVGSLTYRGNRKAYSKEGQPGKVALEMYNVRGGCTGCKGCT